jgi:hypothetical protein
MESDTAPAPWYRILRPRKYAWIGIVAMLVYGPLLIAVSVVGFIELVIGKTGIGGGETTVVALGTGAVGLLAGFCSGYVAGFQRRNDDGPLPEHDRVRWLGPISRRTYYRPTVWNKSLKLTKREFDKLTPEQKSGERFISLTRRQKLRMRWFNRPGAPRWNWDGDDTVQEGWISS